MACSACPVSLICLAGRLHYAEYRCPRCDVRYLDVDGVELQKCPRMNLLETHVVHRECDWCWALVRFGPSTGLSDEEINEMSQLP